MTDQERSATVKLLAAVLKGYPSSKADAQTIAVYVSAFEFYGFTFQQVRAGIMKAMRTSKFFPTVAEICEAAEKMEEHAAGTGKPSAWEAWEEALRFAKERSPYDSRPFKWSCPEVETAVKRFGRMSLWELESKNEGTARAQFRDLYNRVLQDKKDKAVMDMIGRKLGAQYTGLIETTVGKMDMLGEARRDG